MSIRYNVTTESNRYDVGGPRYDDVKDRKASFSTDLKIYTHGIIT